MLKARDGIPDWDRVKALIDEWQPDFFVVGLPLNMDGSESELCLRARKFAKRLHGRYHRDYAMMDERLSSFDAKTTLIEHGGSRDFCARAYRRYCGGVDPGNLAVAGAEQQPKIPTP